MPFDDENEDTIQKPTKGLKINNSKSSIPTSKRIDQAAFDEKASESYQKYEDYKKRTWELSVLFKSFISDNVLSNNKSPISQDLEKETIDKLVLLASDMNSDENQPEGIGGIALSVLLMKCMLIQRDTINSLLYKLEKLSANKSTSQNDK